MMLLNLSVILKVYSQEYVSHKLQNCKILQATFNWVDHIKIFLDNTTNILTEDWNMLRDFSIHRKRFDQHNKPTK